MDNFIKYRDVRYKTIHKLINQIYENIMGNKIEDKKEKLIKIAKDLIIIICSELFLEECIINKDTIKTIHDLAVCNNTIDNFLKLLFNKEKYNLNKEKKDKLKKWINEQIQKSREISKRFFEGKNK